MAHGPVFTGPGLPCLPLTFLSLASQCPRTNLHLCSSAPYSCLLEGSRVPGSSGRPHGTTGRGRSSSKLLQHGFQISCIDMRKLTKMPSSGSCDTEVLWRLPKKNKAQDLVYLLCGMKVNMELWKTQYRHAEEGCPGKLGRMPTVPYSAWLRGQFSGSSWDL